MGKLETRSIEFTCDACGASAPPYIESGEGSDDFEEDWASDALPQFWVEMAMELRQPNPEFPEFAANLKEAVDQAMALEVVPRWKQANPTAQITAEILNGLREETEDQALNAMGGVPDEFTLEERIYVLCAAHAPLLASAGVDINLLISEGVTPPWGAPPPEVNPVVDLSAFLGGGAPGTPETPPVILESVAGAPPAAEPELPHAG